MKLLFLVYFGLGWRVCWCYVVVLCVLLTGFTHKALCIHVFLPFTKGRFTHSMPRPCRSLIHTCHAAPLPCSNSAVSFVEVRMVAGNIRTASRAVWASFCSVLLALFSSSMTNVFWFHLATCIWDWYASDNGLRGTLRGSRKKPNAGLSPTGCLSTAVLCRGLKNGMVGAGHGRSMASVNQTRPHCVNQMGKTHSKPLAARHGMGAACCMWIDLNSSLDGSWQWNLWRMASNHL
jgi:hypothetical protein